MIDLEHSLILGSESIDSNSLNRCFFNLFTKMGEFNSSFLNASSENIPQSPFFSGGYENALTDIDYVSSLNVTSASIGRIGVVPRLFSGATDYENPTNRDSFRTESVTGTFLYDKSSLSAFSPTVDALLRDESPLILKSFVDSEASEVTSKTTIDTNSSPTIQYTSYLLNNKTGISFGTITFNRKNGNSQKNEISIDIKSQLIGMEGVERIKFFTIGNGMSSGVREISENLDMITDVGGCSVTYNSDSDIVISNITKNDSSDNIIIDNDTGRILDDDEEYDYSKCTIISNDELILNFFVIFELKDVILKYSDDLWCFYTVPTKEYGRRYLYDANGWAENYIKYTFENFEAADDGQELDDGTHHLWSTEGTDVGGCTTIASDAFNGCYNATFSKLHWFSPRLRDTERMFKNCKRATFDSIPPSLVLDSARNTRYMFQNCQDAKFANIEKLSLKSASKSSYMFVGCDSATFDKLNEITTNGDSSYMFNDDSKATFGLLETITGSGTKFTSMFEGCDSSEFNRLSTIHSGNETNYIYANRMFYNSYKSTFDALSSIGFESSLGYDGTSMFEGCSSATFCSLTSVGNVKYGNRMFANLDDLREDDSFNKATFSSLHDLGSKLIDGTEMFYNDHYLTTILSGRGELPLQTGNSMFEQTCSIEINGNMNSLYDAEYMFSNTMTAVVRGNMNSLLDGSNMFSYCCSADLSGTANSLTNMESMFLSSDYVHIEKLPSTASNMLATFAGISGECLVNEWGTPSGDTNRYCIQSFENSNNIRINGNIIDGNIIDTSYMFNNAKNIVINNTEMEDVSETNKRYYSITDSSDYAFVQNYDDDSTENPRFTFIGKCKPSEESLSSYATSSDVKNSILCFETINSEGISNYLYTINNSPSAVEGETDIVKFFSDDISLDGISSVRVYTLDSTGASSNYYGTFAVSGDSNTTLSITFKKDGDDNYSFQSMATNYSRTYSDSDKPLIQTFTVVDGTRMTETWTDASEMFHNVVQSSLLSGYDCFISQSLCATDGMFALDNYYPNDPTFDNAGNLFRKMGRSRIQSMDRMFQNRHISNEGVLANIYIEDYNNNISFNIPYTVSSAASAYQNCSINSSHPYIYLDIPSTLSNADHMFDGFSGSKIRLNYDNDEWITLSDGMHTDMMFRNCSFYNDGTMRYKISTPSIYQQIFNYSDFNMNNVTEFEFRDGKNLSYAYDEDDFFFNDDKIMGCSSVSLCSLRNDITDWFNSNATTTTNSVNIEGVYFATLVGPKNYVDSSGEYINYEIMTANRENSIWNIGMSPKSQFSNAMMSDIVTSTNYVRMDSVSSLSNEHNRMTCMFNPSSMFHYTNSKLGDTLWTIMPNSEYSKVDSYSNTVIGGIIRGCVGTGYGSVSLDSVCSINAREMPLAFMGLSNVEFNSLTTIGSNMLAAYGSFMLCNNAKFDNLSSIEIMQYGSENTFTSRFADTEEQKSAWYGNYNNMFYEDSKATFANLNKLTFNTVSNTDSNGNDVRMWFDNENQLYFSFVENSKTTIYTIKIGTYGSTSSDAEKYAISIYDYSGNALGDSSNDGNLTYYTNVNVHENFEIAYEMCEMDSEINIVITMLDEDNKYNYFVVNTNKIKEYPMHPKYGYGKYESENFTVSPFLTTIGGNPSYYSQPFVSLDGENYTIETAAPEEGSTVYTIKLTNETNSDTIIKLGTAYSGDISGKLWLSRLCYESDGTNYVAITLFKSDTTPNPLNISYPDDAVCYRIYRYDGNQYVDEMSVIPGTIKKYSLLLKLENNTDTLISHKAFCSGMFKNCQKATFDNLHSINIPMTGSCAEMFANCKSINLSSNAINMLILPTSYQNDGQYRYDHENYKRIFAGISTNNIQLSKLTKNNTNIYKLGLESDLSTGHHLIGEQLFDGMIQGSTSTAFDLSAGNPFTYQNAIYDIKLDSEIAKMMFDRGKCWSVTYFDLFGTIAKNIEVEYTKPDMTTPVANSVYIPSPSDGESTFEYWMFVDKNGNVIHRAYPNEKSYGPITCSLSAYPIHTQMEGRVIVAHETTSTSVSSIVTDDNTAIETSFNSATAT